MTAPTINNVKYPQPVDELLPAARKLAEDLGEVPSRNRLMRQFRIGAPKAEELRSLLAQQADAPPVEPVTDPWQYAQPIGPVPAGSDPEPGPESGDDARPDPGTDESDEQPKRSRRWFRRRQRPERSPQATDAGHPGTPIPAEPVPTVTPARVEQPPPDRAELRSLKRVRWAVRGVLALGVAASIAGNVLHARDELISQIISAWSPLALLLTIELISRVPVHTRHLAVGRWAATALIAGIAAWVSYWHMAAVAARYGETNGSQYLLPLSVDGLVVVASICLVELGGRIAAANKEAKVS
ncbi:DUF2637 domain-containing protein [Micromonospora sp. LOL_024]|uniref:DUF2637 domain-containing protein n=1 Tax=Micromonospora sp. LOL_024 TaxID=3345412 RepID=UPI003A8997B7